ncbi:MAG: hypothetical protein JXB14_03805 [Candidatus Altiarchaeota archaeon]|nr:hypothetical protein [Candidatus Altiarchaeota archaeon]
MPRRHHPRHETKPLHIKEKIKNPKFIIGLLVLILVLFAVYHMAVVGGLYKDIVSANRVPLVVHMANSGMDRGLYISQMKGKPTPIKTIWELDSLQDLTLMVIDNFEVLARSFESLNEFEAYLCGTFRIFCPVELELNEARASMSLSSITSFYAEFWSILSEESVDDAYLLAKITSLQDRIDEGELKSAVFSHVSEADARRIATQLESEMDDFCSQQKVKFEEDMANQDYVDAYLRISFCAHYW